MATIPEWYDFAERLRAIAMRMLETLEKPVEDEPKIFAITLLARTISNFGAAMNLHESNQIMEARILVRCCWENAFYLAGVASRGAKFVKAMKDEDTASRRARGDLMFKIKLVKADTEDGKQFGAFLKTLAKGSRSLDVKRVADMGAISRGYIFYAQVSDDAAHPTITSLRRHVVETLKWGNTISIFPKIDNDEPVETISYACNALLGACYAAGEMLGKTVVAPEVRKLGDELLRLQGIEPPKETL
jgi:hypothetical protein